MSDEVIGWRMDQDMVFVPPGHKATWTDEDGKEHVVVGPAFLTSPPRLSLMDPAS